MHQVSVSATAPFGSGLPEAAQPPPAPAVAASATGPVWIDEVWAHAGRVAAFARLSLRPATKITNTGHPAGPVSGGTKEVPVAMLAGFLAVGAGV